VHVSSATTSGHETPARSPHELRTSTPHLLLPVLVRPTCCLSVREACQPAVTCCCCPLPGQANRVAQLSGFSAAVMLAGAVSSDQPYTPAAEVVEGDTFVRKG
jgi:hypothetical protein